MVMTAMRPRMNSRAEKSTVRGGAGKGGGGLLRLGGALSIIREIEIEIERKRERDGKGNFNFLSGVWRASFVGHVVLVKFFLLDFLSSPIIGVQFFCFF